MDAEPASWRDLGVIFSLSQHGGSWRPKPPAECLIALYSSLCLSPQQHPAGSNGFIPNFCPSPALPDLLFCRMEAGIGLPREPETLGLSFDLRLWEVLAALCWPSPALCLENYPWTP